MQDPDTYLNELGIKLSCAVDPDAAALIEPEHRIFVNWETYFVSSDAAMEQFMSAPYRFTGKVTDPVTRERFVPTETSPMRRHGDRLFYFSSKEAAAAFDADPDRLSVPMIGMRPMGERSP